MKYYLCKFFLPRPDFFKTMTPEEGSLMKQHVAFMDDLISKRTMVIHGPVDDPAGSWGASIYEVEDDQDMKALTSQDPMVKSGGGRYEIYPMRQLRSRG